MGKPQLNYQLTPEARSMGLTASSLARQTEAISMEPKHSDNNEAVTR